MCMAMCHLMICNGFAHDEIRRSLTGPYEAEVLSLRLEQVERVLLRSVEEVDMLLNKLVNATLHLALAAIGGGPTFRFESDQPRRVRVCVAQVQLLFGCLVALANESLKLAKPCHLFWAHFQR